MDSVQKSKDGSKNVTDERINTITSLVGSMITILISCVVLQRTLASNWRWYELSGAIVYCLGLINLFVMSTLHHGLSASPRVNAVFRTLDYTAIFWLIGGTVSAIVAYTIPTSLGVAVLIGTWSISAIGIALRASIPGLQRHITNTFFITLGWLPAMVLLAFESSRFSLTELFMLSVGGLLYSSGFVVYVTEKPNPIPGVLGFHEIWHVFVLFAALSHAVLVIGMVQ